MAELANRVKAIVLGGGRGTRLHPLTALRAKPAVPLCGRFRLIDIPLSNCIHSGIHRIVVLTQFNSHSLNRHITNTYKFDNFRRGDVAVHAAEQTEATGDWFQGTADAVRKQFDHIRESDVDHYVILSGDQLYRMDYRDLLATHLKNEADITVAALPVTRQDARDFGIMRISPDTRITEFVEKPKDKAVLDGLVTPQKVFDDFGLKSKGKPYLASMGIYAFKASVLEALLGKHPEWVDFGKEILPNALASHKLYAHLFDGFWEDIGTVRSYFDVSIAMTSANPPFEFDDADFPIFTHRRALPGARIREASVNNVIVCPGTRIESATISDSIIGIRSVVHSGARLERCVMLGADYFENAVKRSRRVPVGVGENTLVRQAIIDHNARIGKNCVLCGGDDLPDYFGDGYSIRDGIVVIHRDAVIPDGTKIG